MNPTLKNLLCATLLVMALFSISACGQKGPLVVEKPETEVITTQEKELEETK